MHQIQIAAACWCGLDRSETDIYAGLSNIHSSRNFLLVIWLIGQCWRCKWILILHSPIDLREFCLLFGYFQCFSGFYFNRPPTLLVEKCLSYPSYLSCLSFSYVVSRASYCYLKSYLFPSYAELVLVMVM